MGCIYFDENVTYIYEVCQSLNAKAANKQNRKW